MVVVGRPDKKRTIFSVLFLTYFRRENKKKSLHTHRQVSVSALRDDILYITRTVLLFNFRETTHT